MYFFRKTQIYAPKNKAQAEVQKQLKVLHQLYTLHSEVAINTLHTIRKIVEKVNASFPKCKPLELDIYENKHENFTFIIIKDVIHFNMEQGVEIELEFMDVAKILKKE